jgi:hypothetical protein
MQPQQPEWIAAAVPLAVLRVCVCSKGGGHVVRQLQRVQRLARVPACGEGPRLACGLVVEQVY